MKYIISLSLLVLSMSSHAAFVDSGNYTTDDVTGLQWLDLSLTTNSSINAALASNIGYQAASLNQVQTLFSNMFLGTGLDGALAANTLFNQDTIGFVAAELFTNLFGVTSQSTNSYGLVASSNELFGIEFGLNNVSVATNFDAGLNDNGASEVGWFLVKTSTVGRLPQDVSEPSAIMLLSFGLLMFVRRKLINFAKA